MPEIYKGYELNVFGDTNWGQRQTNAMKALIDKDDELSGLLGEQGPQGSSGYQGPQGPSGTQGVAGSGIKVESLEASANGIIGGSHVITPVANQAYRIHGTNITLTNDVDNGTIFFINEFSSGGGCAYPSTINFTNAWGGATSMKFPGISTAHYVGVMFIKYGVSGSGGWVPVGGYPTA